MRHWKNWPLNEITIDDPLFPQELKKITKCPKKLYYRGTWTQDLWKKTISIVGSRSMTRYGSEVVEKLIPPLVDHQVTIISGFMYGIDGKCHQETIAMGGKTVAVLGNGLDYLFPEEHDKLYSEILANEGLVVSEYEPHFKATLWSFPQRNRIVSGLATLGIIVVEAKLNSGSLITAEYGRKQGKKVYAVPGPITAKTSAGTNFLIATKKAEILLDSQSIFGEKKTTNQLELWENLDDNETKIVTLLENEAMNLDELGKKLQLPIVSISSVMGMLALKGIVEEIRGCYSLKK